MMRIVVYILLFFCVDGSSSQQCSTLCAVPKQCIAYPQCSESEVVHNTGALNRCCPTCVKPIDPNVTCSPGGAPCVIGYQCLQNATGSFSCVPVEESCHNQKETITWTPLCDEDDSFHAKQCKGPNERCFCTDPQGARLFGYRWYKDADNMTCSCSQQVWNLKTKENRMDVSLHCKENGDFEALQCDNGICWCSEPRNGKPLSIIVPNTMMELLACYNKNEVGTLYHRQCESIAIAQAHINLILRRHGVTLSNLPFINCDADGSYGFFQIEENRCFCSWKDRTPIQGWSTGITDMSGVNCNCARDTKYYEIDNIQKKTLICDVKGNYQTTQPYDKDLIFCVDSDGYAIEHTKNKSLGCPNLSSTKAYFSDVFYL